MYSAFEVERGALGKDKKSALFFRHFFSMKTAQQFSRLLYLGRRANSVKNHDWYTFFMQHSPNKSKGPRFPIYFALLLLHKRGKIS